MHFNDLTDKEKEDYKIIAKSKSFDKKYYKKEYNLVKYINPIIHYLKVGVEKGYNPNTEFDTKFYLKHNKDVKNSGMNPFVHYLKYGKREGRSPKPYNTTLDLLLNADLKKKLSEVMMVFIF